LLAKTTGIYLASSKRKESRNCLARQLAEAFSWSSNNTHSEWQARYSTQQSVIQLIVTISLSSHDVSILSLTLNKTRNRQRCHLIK